MGTKTPRRPAVFPGDGPPDDPSRASRVGRGTRDACGAPRYAFIAS
jgi:hypothetical protein